MMRQTAKKYISMLVLSFFVIVSAASAQDKLATDTVKVKTRTGDVHEFVTEMAVSAEEKRKGMMFRTEMGENEAMLFVYPEPQRMNFWMENTFIALDLIFIRENGRIANIIRNAEPKSTDQLKSRGKVIGVLEIKGGRAQELGIKPGDFVLHKLYGTEE